MKRFVIGGVLVLLLLAGGAVAGLWAWNERQTRDVRGSSTNEFVTTDEPGASTRPEPEVKKEPWPMFGYDPARTEFAPYKVRPPYSELWRFRGMSLVEFPPVLAYGRMYFGTNKGRVVAVDLDSGEVAWEHNYSRCIAASPAAGDGKVYAALMVPNPCSKADRDASGFMIAYEAETGRELWRFRAGAIESSPLLANGLVYFGSWDRSVYALDAKTGKKRWAFQTGDEIKGAPAYSSGTVFIGSYDGHVYALRARTGRLKWRASAQPRIGGLGTFYSTPAVAYGRVFIGNTDGKVYAFGAQSGRLLWSKGTGGYVYGSPAIWNRTVYIGSKDNYLYALDAATGDVRWRFRTRGGIFGTPAVINGIVYVAATSTNRTWALDARTGKRVWTFPDGKHSPAVADETHLYLVGHTRIYKLVPKG
jgi:outer membrane protein assembly factor BamB